MFHQFSSWWRALSVVLLGLATLTWPSAAQAATTPSFSVVSQGSVATLSADGASSFALDLAVPRGGVSSVVLSLYSPIVYRSEVSSLIDGVGPSSAALATTALVDPTCATGTRLDLNVSLFSAHGTGTSHHCGTQALHLRLPYDTAACDNVYPLGIAVTIGGTRHIEWSMLAVHSSTVLQPLRVDFVPVVDPTSWSDAALAEANLVAIAHAASTPLTLAVDYRPLSRAVLSATSRAWRQDLTSALASAEHRAIVAPSSSVDFGGLAANGFASEVPRQINLANQLLRSITGRYTDGPLFIEDPTSVASLDALTHAGFKEDVMPDTAFSPTPSTTLGWGEPFALSGVTGVTALATDSGLQQLASDGAIETGRRVAMTLATLAFLHFEAPNAPTVRTIVVPLDLGTVSPAYLNGLLGKSVLNPFITPSTLSASFNTSLIGSDDNPTSRQLAPVAASAWSSANIATLSALLGRTDSYLQAIASPLQTVALNSYSAETETLGDPDARQAALSRAMAYLERQLHDFRIDDSAITLTGSGNYLPITLFSTARYPVTVVLHLITDRLRFPKNSNPQAVTLSASTKSLRIPTTNPHGQSLTLQVELTTPDGNIELAHAAIQVREAGTSVVGYLLSIASLVVLAWWWLRTYRRKSRGRHAR